MPTPMAEHFGPSQVARVANEWGLTMASEEAEALGEAVAGVAEAYGRVAALAAASAPPARPTAPALRPPGDDPYHAWRWRMAPEPEPGTGVLAGRTLAVKDCIAVSGVPMTLGGDVLKDYVPDADATVVQRARAAGAVLVGTAVCEDLCCSGSSFTSATGPVRNPYDTTRSSGGSSSGCAVLVALGEADLALGTDQGGSVRNPAAWTGVCGLKPTFGLVPYTGAFPFEFTLDHIGLLARSAADIAALLDAVAGPSEEDPRQHGLPPPAGSYGRSLGEGLASLRVGVVREGFAWPGLSDPDTDACCRRAAEDLARLGASVEDVSIPLHRHAVDLHVPIATEGSLATVFEQHSQGSNRFGYYDAELARTFAESLRVNAAALPLNARISLIAGTLLRAATGSAVLAHAANLRQTLRRQYDRALERVDVLVMPATPMPAHPLPSAGLSPAEHHELSFAMHRNNCATNLTGHPALSVPCGLVDGLPVGLLVIGRPFDEETVLHIAERYQRDVFPCPSPPGYGEGAR